MATHYLWGDESHPTKFSSLEFSKHFFIPILLKYALHSSKTRAINKTVLDVGCGTGFFLIGFSKLGYKVTGIEIDEVRTKLAKNYCKKYGSDARIITSDAKKLKFRDESFDIVFSHGTIEHFPETEQAVGETYRVLKEDGVAMISVPNRITFFVISKVIQKCIDKVFKTNFWNIGYEQSFAPWRFRTMLESKGFEVLGVRFTEMTTGSRFPIISKTIRILDKPLVWAGVGGHFMYWFVRKAPKQEAILK